MKRLNTCTSGIGSRANCPKWDMRLLCGERTGLRSPDQTTFDGRLIWSVAKTPGKVPETFEKVSACMIVAWSKKQGQTFPPFPLRMNILLLFITQVTSMTCLHPVTRRTETHEDATLHFWVWCSDRFISLPLKKARSTIGADRGSGLMRPLLPLTLLHGCTPMTSQDITPPWGKAPLMHWCVTPLHVTPLPVTPLWMSTPPPLMCHPLWLFNPPPAVHGDDGSQVRRDATLQYRDKSDHMTHFCPPSRDHVTRWFETLVQLWRAFFLELWRHCSRDLALHHATQETTWPVNRPNW